MKRPLQLLALLFILTLPLIGRADITQTTLDPFKVSGTTITPRVSTNGFQIPSISGSTQCIHVDSTGKFTGTGADCGAGGGGGAGTITTSTPAVTGYFPTWASSSTLTGTSSLFQLTGNIGIGTSTPTALLSLPTGTTAANGINFGDATADLYRGGAGQLATDGKFGVGLVPGSGVSLNVKGGANWGVIRIQPSADAGEASIGFDYSATHAQATAGDTWLFGRGLGGVNARSFGIVGFNVLGGNPSVVLDNAGNVGLADTISPAYSLDINPPAGIVSGPLLRVATSTGAGLFVLNNGNVGIGTTTPSRSLVVVGSTTITSLGTGAVSSVSGSLVNDPTVPACTKHEFIAAAGAYSWDGGATSTLATASSTQDIATPFSLPAQGKVTGLTMKHTTAFTGIANENATNGLVASIGITSPIVNRLAYSGSTFDVGSATSTTNMLDIGGMYSPIFTSHTPSLTLTSSCSSGNCYLSGLTAGTLDVWMCQLILP